MNSAQHSGNLLVVQTVDSTGQIKPDKGQGLIESIKRWVRKKNNPFGEEESVKTKDTCVKAIANFYDLGCDLLFHPPYFSDLTPSDYFVFTNLKKLLRVFALFHNCEPHMDSVQQTGDQANLRTWDSPGKLKLKTSKLSLSANEVMAIVFWAKKTMANIIIPSYWTHQTMSWKKNTAFGKKKVPKPMTRV